MLSAFINERGHVHSPSSMALDHITSQIKEGIILVAAAAAAAAKLLSCVQLCATPETAAHQAPPSLGFSRQEHWSGLPFPSPVHESEK